MLCTTWYHFPVGTRRRIDVKTKSCVNADVPFKKRENHLWQSGNFSKFAGFSVQIFSLSINTAIIYSFIKSAACNFIKKEALTKRFPGNFLKIHRVTSMYIIYT